jgi:hypothetical protein
MALEAAARLIREHPELPVELHSANPLSVSVLTGTDKEKQAEIDRIAAVLGVTAAFVPGTRLYTAVYRIGESVAYMATARVLPADDRESRALAVIGAVA